MKRSDAALAYALAAVILWSTVATAFKIALKFYTPLQLIFLSTLTSLLVFAAILTIERKIYLLFDQKPKHLLHSALLGLLSPTGYYLILFEAYRRLPAQVAQPLNYTWVIVLSILSVPLLGQKLNKRKIIGITLGFIGAFIISTQGKLNSLHIKDPIGVSLAIGSSIFWALFWIFNRLDSRHELVKLFTNFAFALLYLTAIMAWKKGFNLKLGSKLLAPIYIGLFEMGITFYLWTKAMQLTDSSAKISNLVFLSPFLSLIFIHFILGETLYATTFLGLILIIVGIWLNQK